MEIRPICVALVYAFIYTAVGVINQYIKLVVEALLVTLWYDIGYMVEDSLDWMELISLQSNILGANSHLSRLLLLMADGGSCCYIITTQIRCEDVALNWLLADDNVERILLLFLLNSNLEDKVLLEAGSIVMNQVDYIRAYGLEVFQILTSRPKKLHSFKITGIGSSMELLESTGRRLTEFADSFGLPFEFKPVEGKIGNITDLSQLGVKVGETTVVNWMHHCLYDITGSDLGTFRLLTLLRPKLITTVEPDLGHGGIFLGRFVEALHYYSALFDALGDGLSEESVERHMVEQQLFGSEIRNIVALGGPKRTGEVPVERWGDELKRVGFLPVSLSGTPAAQASLLLGMFPRGYTLVEENGCLKMGWKALSLLTASAWQPCD
ncbi:scarecrow-like protein 23 [Lycium ferocissimum]|uniref:scarecrow-like protein 23 n=1 Tax=Lycium ferocissimum TaxID=112874 RepID=UPI002815386E|nr:scarecrow-like protein 23 [Lycium ferocissimum]